MITYKKGQISHSRILNKGHDLDPENFDEAHVYELKSLEEEQVHGIEDDEEVQLPNKLNGIDQRTQIQDDIRHPQRAEQSQLDSLKHLSRDKTQSASKMVPLQSPSSIPGSPASYRQIIPEKNSPTAPLTPQPATTHVQKVFSDEKPSPDIQTMEGFNVENIRQHEEASNDVHPIVAMADSSGQPLGTPLPHPNSSQSSMQPKPIDVNSLHATVSASFQPQPQPQQPRTSPLQGISTSTEVTSPGLSKPCVPSFSPILYNKPATSF